MQMDTVVALPLLWPRVEISGCCKSLFLLLQHAVPQGLVQDHSPAPYVVASMMEETHAISL